MTILTPKLNANQSVKLNRISKQHCSTEEEIKQMKCSYPWLERRDSANQTFDQMMNSATSTTHYRNSSISKSMTESFQQCDVANVPRMIDGNHYIIELIRPLKGSTLEVTVFDVANGQKKFNATLGGNGLKHLLDRTNYDLKELAKHLQLDAGFMHLWVGKRSKKPSLQLHTRFSVQHPKRPKSTLGRCLTRADPMLDFSPAKRANLDL